MTIANQQEKPTKNATTTLSPSPSAESETARQAIRRRLKATIEAMNAKPWSPDAVDVALDVLQRLPSEAVVNALGRCALEIAGDGYQPTLSLGDITKRTGIPTQSEIDDAECRAAWDALLVYADKYIVADAEGVYGPRHYFAMRVEIPELDARTADTLRRVGGWKAVKTMTEDDYPFVQKRFYEEYRAWSATDAALSRGALNGNEAFKGLLASRSMPEPKRIATVREEVKQLKGQA